LGRPAAGEEWRAMDTGARGTAPAGADAALAAARARIAQHRCRDVELRVVDRGGRPVGKLPVEVVQTRHAFPFGSNLWQLDTMFRFGEQDTDRAACWKSRFAEVFNAASAMCYWTERPRNDAAKTEDVQGRNTLEGFVYCVDWAAAQGLIPKGHPLFWSIPKAVPEWVKRYDYATQMKFLEVRIRSIVARCRGKVKLWDAINEPLWEPAFKNLPQRHWPHLDPIDAIADYVEPVLRWARDEDPDACYLVNDYGLEADPPQGPPVAADGTRATAPLQRRRFLELLACLGERGVAPDAIGLQSHTGGWIDPGTQTAVYDEMASAGLPIHITEFWANTSHLDREDRLPRDVVDAMQADYVADYLTCAFGHPAVEGFFFWGFMEQAIRWDERSGHEPRPVFARVRDLIHQEWTTREQLVTDADGRVRFRGFLGDYALRCRVSGSTRQGVPFAVSRQQAMPLTLVAPFGAAAAASG